MHSISLLDLPDEIFVIYILPLLSVPDYGNLCRTCKRFKEVLDDQSLWRRQVIDLVDSKGSYKQVYYIVSQLQKHLSLASEQVEVEKRAAASSEQLRIVLENNLDQETRINQALVMKIKGLEEEVIWLFEGQKNQVYLETQLQRALQDVESLRRMSELYEERLASKERELKLLERRKDNLENELKNVTEELSELRVTKRDLIKSNRHLKTQLIKEKPLPLLPKNKF
eukprot:TRINITY_DN4832_c0_g1_i1.p1 TRINITY_DN4832_c0_g1~~TRINITY_DN4832_c0_g1_i1.p1  ORF type:complete len:226 (+),score=63.94 TRINITY_DN4832_c0_g1_i1:57-734(+)